MSSGVAQTQYGDFKGTVSIDGFNGPFLHQLWAKVTNHKPGYVPIGFSFYAGNVRGDDRFVSLDVLATKTDKGGDALRELARSSSVLYAERFQVEIDAMEFFALMKRVHIVATDRIIGDTPIDFEI